MGQTVDGQAGTHHRTNRPGGCQVQRAYVADCAIHGDRATSGHVQSAAGDAGVSQNHRIGFLNHDRLPRLRHRDRHTICIGDQWLRHTASGDHDLAGHDWCRDRHCPGGLQSDDSATHIKGCIDRDAAADIEFHRLAPTTGCEVDHQIARDRHVDVIVVIGVFQHIVTGDVAGQGVVRDLVCGDPAGLRSVHDFQLFDRACVFFGTNEQGIGHGHVVIEDHLPGDDIDDVVTVLQLGIFRHGVVDSISRFLNGSCGSQNHAAGCSNCSSKLAGIDVIDVDRARRRCQPNVLVNGVCSLYHVQCQDITDGSNDNRTILCQNPPQRDVPSALQVHAALYG